jgi:hypothetical protein
MTILLLLRTANQHCRRLVVAGSHFKRGGALSGSINALYLTCAGAPAGSPAVQSGKWEGIIQLPQVGGLQHRYERRADRRVLGQAKQRRFSTTSL